CVHEIRRVVLNRVDECVQFFNLMNRALICCLVARSIYPISEKHDRLSTVDLVQTLLDDKIERIVKASSEPRNRISFDDFRNIPGIVRGLGQEHDQVVEGYNENTILRT